MSEKKKNTVDKKENSGYQYFSLFHDVFKACHIHMVFKMRNMDSKREKSQLA